MPAGFVDIHCHLLPDIDDGPATMPDALAMARVARDDGIETVIVTPHADHHYPARPRNELLERVGAMQRALERADIALRVLPGADVHITESLAQRVQRQEVMTLADTGRYLLLELPHDLYFPISRTIQELSSIGTVTILSHPERNRGIQGKPDVLWELVAEGCLLQVTAGSILGTFGRRAKSVALEMLDHQLVHFVASDAHDTRVRKPLLSEAWKVIAERIGKDRADLLCKDFPQAVTEGRPIIVPTPKPRAKSFLARLLAG